MLDRSPLVLLAGLETLDNANEVLQGSQVRSQLGLDLVLVGTQFLVERLAVWASAQGGGEDGLDQEAVVRLQRSAVRVSERLGELLRGLGYVLAQCNTREVQATARRIIGQVNRTG